jgi:hypothetical protein
VCVCVCVRVCVDVVVKGVGCREKKQGDKGREEKERGEKLACVHRKAHLTHIPRLHSTSLDVTSWEETKKKKVRGAYTTSE